MLRTAWGPPGNPGQPIHSRHHPGATLPVGDQTTLLHSGIRGRINDHKFARAVTDLRHLRIKILQASNSEIDAVVTEMAFQELRLLDPVFPWIDPEYSIGPEASSQEAIAAAVASNVPTRVEISS